MNNLKPAFTIILTAIIVIAAYNAAYTQGFRGILPGKTNCSEVERIYQIKACSQPEIVLPEQVNELVRFKFSKQLCEKIDGKRWDVPIGTVLKIEITLNNYVNPNSLKLDSNEFIKGGNDIQTYFTNEKEGIKYIFDGFEPNLYRVYSITYFPNKETIPLCSLKKTKILYPDVGDDFDFFRDFNSERVLIIQHYWKVSTKQENQLLKEAIDTLKERIMGYSEIPIFLFYYYNSRSEINSGKRLANHAKNYLERNGFDSDKIKIYNGGKSKDKPELYIIIEQ